MLEEVDFRKEAGHLEQFGDFLDRSGLRGVATCPRVYRQYSSERCAPALRAVLPRAWLPACPRACRMCALTKPLMMPLRNCIMPTPAFYRYRVLVVERMRGGSVP
jgi:hypothetical protein